jgi:hypothetical protein
MARVWLNATLQHLHHNCHSIRHMFATLQHEQFDATFADGTHFVDSLKVAMN